MNGSDISFLAAAGTLKSRPGIGPVIEYPYVQLAGQVHKLYKQRRAAIGLVKTEFFCFLDGEPDELLNLDIGVSNLMKSMNDKQAAIGYGDEFVHDVLVPSDDFTLEKFYRNPFMIHHGVVCRTKIARDISWPLGNYAFDVLLYGLLAMKGAVYLPGAYYKYRPTKTGARNLPGYTRGVVNSLLWLDGKPGVHLAREQE